MRDFAGNADETSDTIILDTEPPHSQLIFINRNDEVTDTGEVTLTVRAEDLLTGVDLMSFSYDGINWTDWEDYRDYLSKPFKLTAGDGLKTVHFRTMDRAGNTAYPIFDTIELITEVPENEEEEAPLVKTEVESNDLIFILIIIAVMISVSLVSMVYYKKRKDRIKKEKEAVIRSTPPSQVLKPKTDGLPAAPIIPQLPVTSPAVSATAPLQLPPAQIGTPAPTDTGKATEQTKEQPAPEWSALFDNESPDSEKKDDFPCSLCGNPLTRVPGGGRFYCDTCQKYK